MNSCVDIERERIAALHVRPRDAFGTHRADMHLRAAHRVCASQTMFESSGNVS